mmetsp:Transcript_30685/g.44866  ORF Transcript_30685/g.44866 Transcript_30685/m.44866 type:complete len:84 (+) Transcript_30685:721-972(+)
MALCSAFALLDVTFSSPKLRKAIEREAGNLDSEAGNKRNYFSRNSLTALDRHCDEKGRVGEQKREKEKEERDSALKVCLCVYV